MATRDELKAYFEAGDTPTAAQFGALIDSLLNLSDDDYTALSGLVAALAAKADDSALTSALAGKSDTGHGHAISDVTSLQSSLDAKAGTSHTHAISDVTGLQTDLDAKAASSHNHTSDDITDLVEQFLTEYNDGAVIDILEAATFTNDVATVAGWAQGRFYHDDSFFYLAVEQDTVKRWAIGAHSAGTSFDPDEVLTRKVGAVSTTFTTTTGADGDPYVTGGTEDIGGMTITINNADPANNIGIKKLAANNYLEAIGANNVEIKITTDSTQGAGDKGASPFKGPWFWYVVAEHAGSGVDIFKMSSGGTKGIKIENLSSKATIKVNNTMHDWTDMGVSSSGGVSIQFKDNWTVGSKYLIAGARMSSGINSAWLGTLTSGSTPGTNLEHRTTHDFDSGNTYIDDFDNIDPTDFVMQFHAGTKIYEIGYLAGEPDRSLINDIFNRALTLI